MCTNATKTAASLMSAIEPTLKSLLTFTGIINTPQGVAAIAAYDAALAALQNWKSGTASQNVLELIAAFQSVFNALPIPANVAVLVNLILGGVEAAIGVITANSPAPVGVAEDATAEETQAMHQAHVIADTTAKVQALVPTFKRSIFSSPASQYTKAWNAAVSNGGFDPALAV